MAEKPQPTDVKLGSSPLFIPLTCRRCQHFAKMAHPAYEHACSTLGILPEAKPCERFSPDAGQIRFSNPRHARNITDTLRQMGETDLLTLASLAAQERRTRRYGFQFGETVYLQAFGGDYLSNYRRAKVTSADSKYVYILADEGFTAMVFHDSVMKAGAWQKKLAWLEAHERITDPRLHKYVRVPSQAEIIAEKTRIRMDALDLSISNGGEFSEGARPERSRPERITPLDQLLADRPAMPQVLRVR